MNPAGILIVDDDANIRELILVNLTAAGYEVKTASDGKEAIEKISSFLPALIILDIMMPEIDGWEVCKFVRDDPYLEHIKIIMLTARGSDRDKLIGKGILKADDYLTKPFDIDELMSIIKRRLYENES
jgi:two-component system, OmpR family, alkaline phosphatase synthesis response regulator PhoP